MIHGIPCEALDGVERVLTKMRQSIITFYPTGSRVFGNLEVGVKRDHDFYTEKSIDVERWLKLEGFHLVDNDPNYIDSKTTIQVYRIFEDRSDHIDVQLVEDLRAKHSMQDILLKHKQVLRFGNKPFNREVWHIVQEAYDAGVKRVYAN